MMFLGEGIMVKKSKKTREIVKALGASRVVRIGKGWDWKMASLAEKKLCVCGTANKHLPHCPYNEVGVDFSDMAEVLKKMERDYGHLAKLRDPERIQKILGLLGKIWRKNPDLRLGQLIENMRCGGFYFIEDEELLRKLEKFYSKKNRR